MPDLPRTFWSDVIEVLHGLLTSIVARGQYPEMHPSIDRADETATAMFARLQQRVPEVVVAVVDGELVIAERPMPELRARLPALLDAFARHGVECLVFLQGLEKREMAALAAGLAAASEAARPAIVRERLQNDLRHVLVRWVALRDRNAAVEEGAESSSLVEARVSDLFLSVGPAVQNGREIDQAAIRDVARMVLDAATSRNFTLRVRGCEEGPLDMAGHAANVAVMSAAMALQAQLPASLCIEVAAAAIVHDVGHLLLPPQIQGVAEPLLDERARKYARHHSFLGARALLDGGCPPLWVATALDHHRGVDGRGYPTQSSVAPHDGTRVVSIANYMERKRIPLKDDPDAPEEAVRGAFALSGRYFDPIWLAAYLRAIGVFSPGMVVELTDGQPAMVIRANPGDPLRPEVRKLFGDEAGSRIDLSRFNVLERRYEISIVRALLPKLQRG